MLISSRLLSRSVLSFPIPFIIWNAEKGVDKVVAEDVDLARRGRGAEAGEGGGGVEKDKRGKKKHHRSKISLLFIPLIQ